jgi:hypothetical protein
MSARTGRVSNHIARQRRVRKEIESEVANMCQDQIRQTFLVAVWTQVTVARRSSAARKREP